jgi:hypothetical protein
MVFPPNGLLFQNRPNSVAESIAFRKLVLFFIQQRQNRLASGSPIRGAGAKRLRGYNVMISPRRTRFSSASRSLRLTRFLPPPEPKAAPSAGWKQGAF